MCHWRGTDGLCLATYIYIYVLGLCLAIYMLVLGLCVAIYMHVLGLCVAIYIYNYIRTRTVCLTVSIHTRTRTVCSYIYAYKPVLSSLLARVSCDSSIALYRTPS